MPAVERVARFGLVIPNLTNKYPPIIFFRRCSTRYVDTECRAGLFQVSLQGGHWRVCALSGGHGLEAQGRFR